MKYATAVLDAKNGVTNPTLGEMIDPAVEAIQQLLDEAYKKGYIDGGISEITK